jgi:hypothetical protein
MEEEHKQPPPIPAIVLPEYVTPQPEQLVPPQSIRF